MKEIFRGIHRPARRAFVIGWAVVAAVLAASTVLYIGAGRIFDYYSAVSLSEALLASVRPLSIAACGVSVSLEYRSKRKKDSAG